MAAYVVVQIDVQDPVTYEQYKTLASSAVTAYDGRYVVRGGRSEILEGSWQPSRLVVLEFPTMERARAWWSSARVRAGEGDPPALRADGDAGDRGPRADLIVRVALDRPHQSQA